MFTRTLTHMFTPRATLPTLLGALIFILGLYAFLRVPTGQGNVSQPTTVQTTPAPQIERSVTLVNAAIEETRTVSVQTPETPSAVLEATLGALRTWLLETLWPEALGVPTVFQLGEQAVLDFPLSGSPAVSVRQEQQLLASVERTLAEQGISEVVILANGRSRPVFLAHLAVEDGLE